MISAQKLLSKGLQEGYAGTTTFGDTQRASQHLKTSHFISKEGIYDDQWINARLGGGQELGVAGDEKATRVYAGGTVEPEILEKLGITGKDVIVYLQKKIKELGDKTRLDADCTTESDGDWQYAYHVLKSVDSIDLTLGLETISYKGTQIFAHGFVISPIKD